MSLEEHKALVRRLNHEAFDLGDETAAGRYLATDFLNHLSGKRGVEDFLRIIRYVRAAFGDSQTTVDQEVADGKIAEHWAVRDDLSMLLQIGAQIRAPPVGGRATD